MGHLKNMAKSVTQCLIMFEFQVVLCIRVSRDLYRYHFGMQNNNTDASLHFGKTNYCMT